MHSLWNSTIESLCKAASVRTFIEIGVGEAQTTRSLVEYAKKHDGHVHAVDTISGQEIRALVAEAGSLLTFHNRTSLEILPSLRADAVLIDGDHNWYTVLHELKAIAAWREEGTQEPMIFLHDTGWPYGRRDLYYDVSRIPQEFQHVSATLGLDPSSRDLVPAGGINSTLRNACQEGGRRNGVLTAVEDFLKTEGKRWHWLNLPGMHGLGILAPESRIAVREELAKIFTQLQLHPLLQGHLTMMEQDRLLHLIRTIRVEERLNMVKQTAAQKIMAFHAEKEAMRESSRMQIMEKDKAITQLQQEVHHIKQSRSWRWAQPVRIMHARLRDVLRRGSWKLGVRQRRILVIDHRPLTPDRDSGSLRMYRLLRILRDMRCAITFVPNVRGQQAEDHALLRSACIRVPDDSVESHLAKEGAQYDIVILSRAPVAAQHFTLVRACAPRARIIFDTVDLHTIRLHRQANITGESEKTLEAQHTELQELVLMKTSDCTVVVSEEERGHIREIAPETAVFTISNIHDVRPSVRSFAQRRDILFLGNFFHAPNVDAMQHFLQEIFPHIHALLPDIRLHVIGEGGKETLSSLRGERVLLHGHVRDIEKHFEHARLSVAPLRFGAGVKGKIHSSLSFGTPVVTTSIGAEGMHLHHERNCLIADDPNAFASAVHRLYTDQELWQRLVTEGCQTMRTHFSQAVAKKCCKAMLRHLDKIPVHASPAR